MELLLSVPLPHLHARSVLEADHHQAWFGGHLFRGAHSLMQHIVVDHHAHKCAQLHVLERKLAAAVLVDEEIQRRVL